MKLSEKSSTLRGSLGSCTPRSRRSNRSNSIGNGGDNFSFDKNNHYYHKSPLSMEISASGKKSLVDNTPSNHSMNNSSSKKTLWNDEEYHSKMDQIGSFKMIIDHNDDNNEECNANYDAHPIVAADADNPNQHLKARSLRRSTGTRKFNQMITRIISNRKSKTRQRSVDKTVSSYGEEDFEFSARTLKSVQDDYSTLTTITTAVGANDSATHVQSTAALPPARGLSAIRCPIRVPQNSTIRSVTYPDMTTTKNNDGLLETIDEKLVGSGSYNSSTSSSQSLSSSITKTKSSKSLPTILSKSKSTLTSQMEDAKLIQFLYKDPRWKLMQYHDEVVKTYGDLHSSKQSSSETSTEAIEMFSVWRLTSNDSIKKMMRGEATGKGLDIKGKSAKTGLLSGFVPFLQIHSNQSHKFQIATLPKDASIRLYFKSPTKRQQAIQQLQPILQEMRKTYQHSRQFLLLQQMKNNENNNDEKKNCFSDDEDIMINHEDQEEKTERALQYLSWEMATPTINILPEIDNHFGIDLPERLFWEACVVRKDITRTPGTLSDTGRPSEPAFQDMNFTATRIFPDSSATTSCNHTKTTSGRQAVILQHGGLSSESESDEDPLCPLSLLMAYQENNRILPVSSDFDMFLVGTKGLVFESSLPPDQVELQQKLVSKIEMILEETNHQEEGGSNNKRSWTANWLDILKKTTKQVYEVPKLGFGDPTSCSLVEHAVCSTASTGAVRHGAECFNYSFPQELDKKFLVVSRKWKGIMPWRYLTLEGLQDYLMNKVEQGFVFPLNPKWILCDPGWKPIYDALLRPNNKIQHSHDVETSLNVWYPPTCGIRESIERIHSKYPHGFQQVHTSDKGNDDDDDIHHDYGDTSAMDLAELQLKRYLALQRAKRKLLFIIRLSNMMKATRRKRLNETASEDSLLPRRNE